MPTLSTTHGATGSQQTDAWTLSASSFFKKYWSALRERRERRRLRTALYDLSDQELKDIGTTRGEIDYVASNRSLDLRRIGSIPLMNI